MLYRSSHVSYSRLYEYVALNALSRQQSHIFLIIINIMNFYRTLNSCLKKSQDQDVIIKRIVFLGSHSYCKPDLRYFTPYPPVLSSTDSMFRLFVDCQPIISDADLHLRTCGYPGTIPLFLSHLLPNIPCSFHDYLCKILFLVFKQR